MRMPHTQPGAGLALKQLNRGGIVVPFGAEQLDGTGLVVVGVARPKTQVKGPPPSGASNS